MAATDITAPEVQARGRSRAERARLSRERRAETAKPNLLQGMGVSDRQFEREKRKARAPRLREQRLAARATRPAPLREQVETLQAQVQSLTDQLARRKA